MAMAELHARTLGAVPADQTNRHDDLHELLTVEEVASLLKVSKSWVYEHTRSRHVPRAERLPAPEGRQVRAVRTSSGRARSSRSRCRTTT